MKIGILTFCEANNYGAMCQAFALQYFLKNNGFDATLLRYRNRSIYIQYHFRRASESKTMMTFLKRNINVLLNFKRNCKFALFRKTLPITRILNREDLVSYSNHLDALVVGSDQVWNPRNTGNDKTFLLDYETKCAKKIAYAASIANTSFFMEFGNDAIKHIKNFTNISLREEEGVTFLKKYGIRSTLVLDPVLLINANEWRRIIKKKSMPKARYIFVYQLKPDLNFITYLNELSSKTGLKIFILPYLYPCKRDARRLKNKKILYDLSPNDFLYFLSNAEVVVTDSFHGTALSIALNKDFYVSLDKSKNNTNSRMVNLLNICGLNDRIVDFGLSPAVINKIDYLEVERKLDSYREISSTFLLNALKK